MLNNLDTINVLEPGLLPEVLQAVKIKKIFSFLM